MTLKNTDNTYIINIVNSQTIDSVTEEIREHAEGAYYIRGGKKYIMYKSADEDNNSYSSTVIVSPEGVAIKRRGAVTSNMTLDTLRRTYCVYIMPYGKMNMEIETKSIVSTLDEDGGELRLQYTLIINDEKYYNDMTIHVIGGRK